MRYLVTARAVVRVLITIGIALTLLLGGGAPSDFTGAAPPPTVQVVP